MGSEMCIRDRCFRAQSPERLVERQTQTWDPPLTWLHQTHGLALIQTTGIAAVDQPPRTLQNFSAWLGAQSSFALMALHDLIGMSGSIVLARALVEGHMGAEQAWEASVLDEMWNIELWGEDDEAKAVRTHKQSEFLAAFRFWQLQGDAP